jgi:hypothetical protein
MPLCRVRFLHVRGLISGTNQEPTHPRLPEGVRVQPHVVELAHCSTKEFPRGRIALFQAAGSMFRRCAILTEFYALALRKKIYNEDRGAPIRS